MFNYNVKQKLSIIITVLLLFNIIFAVPYQVSFGDSATLPGARSVETSGDIYLGGNYIEVGIDKNGWFGGSIAAPSGFHPISRANIGMVADDDGFDIGNTPVTGDFFLPGGPFEGYGIGYITALGATVIRANVNPSLDGNFNKNMAITNLSSGDTLSAIHTVDDGKIKLEQTVTFDKGDKYFKIDVKMTNISDETLSDVRYFRTIDPDQDFDLNSTSFTKNKVVENPTASDKAFVYAKGLVTDAPFFYVSFDSTARGSVTSSNDPYSLAMYNVDGNALINPEVSQDTHIAMTFDKGDIDAGKFVTMTLFASLDGDLASSLGNIIEAKALDDPYLTGLTVENGELSPVFAKGADTYVAILPVGTTSTRVTPNATTGATTTVNSVSVANGNQSLPINVAPGHNQIIISVTDGSNVKDITIDAIVASNYLSSLTVDTGILLPFFNSVTEEYAVYYPDTTTSASVIAVPLTSGATVTINSIPVTSGSPNLVSLNKGVNRILVVVKAEDNSEKTYTILANRAILNSYPSDNSSDSNDSNSSTGAAINQGSVAVIVNGISENYGNKTEKTIGGIKTVRFTYNSTKLNELITKIVDKAKDDTKNIIKIPAINSTADVIEAVLTGDVIKKMGDSDFDLNISTGKIDYIIDAKEFGIKNLAQKLGISLNSLKSIDVEVIIEKSSSKLVKAMETNAKLKNHEILFPPTEFRINAKTVDSSGKSKSVEVSTFTNFVERIIKIPSNVDYKKITTGVVYNEDGTFSHVPTVIFEKGGIWYASLKSLTNSSYTVLWNDVKVDSVKNHWSKDVVNSLASRLVIDKIGYFNPEGNISRSDFATYIVKALGLYRSDAEITRNYSDINSSSNRANAISVATKYGIIEGYEDNTFRPEDSITRVEAMVIIARAIRIAGIDISGTNSLGKYTDYSDIPRWAAQDVDLTVSNRVFTGMTSTTLNPYSTFKYGEAAQTIMNMLENTNLTNK